MTAVLVVKGYPRLSETFIAQEILGLQRRGVALAIASLRHPTDAACHPIHAEITAPVHYLPEYLHREPRRSVAAWRRATALPGYAAARSAFIADCRRDPTRNRVRRFGQACVLAAELPAGTTHLHAHFMHTPASVARYAARMCRLPFSVSAHARDIWTTPGWDLAAKLREAAWTVTCSAAGAERLRALEPDHPAELIYHGLDLDRFPPMPDRRPARNGTDARDPVRLLCVARAVDKKGIDVLLGALAELPGRRHWTLDHIGGGPGLGTLQRQALRHGLGNRIRWHGPQPQHAVLRALRRADVFALACRQDRDGDQDGLPNVLMEAQSQALPVVATRISGIPELIVDAETGLLAAPGDPRSLALALDRLIADPSLRDRLGGAGERRLRAAFDAESWLDRLAPRFTAPGTAPSARAA
ncbi:MAG: glycosyltransferase [Alphaproteobacteria bacterium]|nr:glycosyltransferase [Alphaproteobacteria bacterium]